MKQALLYNPKEKRNITNPVLPFSLMSVATVWKSEGYNTVIVDGRLGERIEDFLTPDVKKVGITSMTGSALQDAIGAARKVKDYNKDIKVIFGGFHASLMPEQTLVNENIDEVMVGRYSDIDRIDYSIDMGKYIRDEGGIKMIDVISSSGCPYRCAYCAISKVYGRKWLPFDLEGYFFPLLKWLHDEHGVRGIHIMDDNFFVDIGRAEKICDYIIKNKLKLKIWAMCRTNIFSKLDNRTLWLLRAAGFDILNFGAESGSQDILDYIKKDITVDDTIESARRCKEHGFNAEYSFMIGFPGEKKTDINATFDLIDKLTSMLVCDIKLFMYCPFPGTPLYEDALLHGLEEPKSLSEWEAFEYENLVTPWVPKHIKKMFNVATYCCWFAFTPSLDKKYDAWWQRLGYSILKGNARTRWRMRMFGFAPEWWVVKKIVRG